MSIFLVNFHVGNAFSCCMFAHRHTTKPSNQPNIKSNVPYLCVYYWLLAALIRGHVNVDAWSRRDFRMKRPHINDPPLADRRRP